MMSVMKKILPIAGVIASYFSFAQFAFAEIPCPTGFSVCSGSGDFGKVIGTVITLAFTFAVVVALGYLIYGGIKWILSEGDKTKVEESRNHVIAAVIGLIVVFLSYFILNIVLTVFGGGASLSNISIPSIGGSSAVPTLGFCSSTPNPNKGVNCQ